VVTVAAAQREAELGLLIASGSVDFVPRAGDFLHAAARAVQRRVQSLDCAEDAELSAGELSRDFGEILRHEVNNPLTGILGNAELLLARRDRLPAAAIERVETIADLAVRLRETVRRLSHAWGERPAGPA
jgi:signal transduction histidine kinase